MIFVPIPIFQCPECAPNMGPGLNLEEVSVRRNLHPVPPSPPSLTSKYGSLTGRVLGHHNAGIREKYSVLKEKCDNHILKNSFRWIKHSHINKCL